MALYHFRNFPGKDMRDILFYVSGHGYGHATRIAALIRALRALGPRDLRIHVRTQAPRWLFTDADPDASCSEAPIDVGMLQHNPLDVDLPGTLSAHEAFCARWDAAVAREADWMRDLRPLLVAGDVPALAFAAAHRAGVRSLAVANFSWDWILESYAASDARWAPIARRYAEAYSRAQDLLRLPLCCPMPAFRRVTDVPLLARKPTKTREQAREAIGIAPSDRRRVVLVTFGGLGGARPNLDACDDLSDYLFIGFGEEPAGLRAGWIGFPHRTPIPHVDLMAASDAVLTKPGYGIFAESLALHKRVLYLPRDNFPEIPFLVDGLRRLGSGLEMPRPDFFAGRWLSHLESLFALREPAAEGPCDGAEAIAALLLEKIA